MFPKHRRRRVLYNDDSDQQYVRSRESYGYEIVDDQSFLDARTTPTFDTHVDTYVWCLGNGADPPWGGTPELFPCLPSNGYATDLIVRSCHEHGVDVWGSLRMNDLHDATRSRSLDETSDPMKALHPEWMIEPEELRPEESGPYGKLADGVSEHYLWSAFNFELPAVRDYRLAYIEKTAREHDLDGFELDFTRFTWYFTLGRERSLAHLMTNLVRRVRRSLDRVAEERNRHYTLAVHVFDSIETSLNLGLDVETWVDEGLVDALVVGTGYLPYILDLDEWLDLAMPREVPVYPSFNTNTIEDWRPMLSAPAYHEALRAISAHYWSAGADGQYIFNHFCQRNWQNVEDPGGLDLDYIYAPLLELGDPVEMLGKDKLYAIQTHTDQAMHQQALGPAPLPIALDSLERSLPLQIGPDGDNPDAETRVRAYLTGGSDSTNVWLRLNHTLLDATRRGEWVEATVPRGVLRSGENVLGIWCDQELNGSPNPVILHRVFVPVEYGSSA